MVGKLSDHDLCSYCVQRNERESFGTLSLTFLSRVILAVLVPFGSDSFDECNGVHPDGWLALSLRLNSEWHIVSPLFALLRLWEFITPATTTMVLIGSVQFAVFIAFVISVLISILCVSLSFQFRVLLWFVWLGIILLWPGRWHNPLSSGYLQGQEGCLSWELQRPQRWWQKGRRYDMDWKRLEFVWTNIFCTMQIISHPLHWPVLAYSRLFWWCGHPSWIRYLTIQFTC